MIALANKFNIRWSEGSINKPLIILIGGYAGTGKSTLASSISQQLNSIQIIPTGIIRSIAQTQENESANPSLHKSTYDLFKLDSKETTIINNFNKQVSSVNRICDSVIEFMGIEKQNLIIEGNHVVPWHSYQNNNCHIIELYLKVSDKNTHKKMLGGPTHQRTFSEEQYTTGFLLSDYINSEVLKANKVIFEYNDIKNIEKYINNKIANLLNDK